MKLEPFIRYQNSYQAYMCINLEHTMPLVALYNLDDKVELRCFCSDCDFKITPGLNMYEKVMKAMQND